MNEQPDWTFLTNHGHALVCIAEDADIRLRDLAERIGITERAAQSIVSDLVAAGYVRREREGRRNTYSVNRRKRMRHSIESHQAVGPLLDILSRPDR